MTRLKTTDDDDPLENDEPELSVNYNLGDETPSTACCRSPASRARLNS